MGIKAATYFFVLSIFDILIEMGVGSLGDLASAIAASGIFAPEA